MKAERYVHLGYLLRLDIRRQCRPALPPAFKLRLMGAFAPVPNWRNPLVNMVAEQIVDGEVGDEN